MDGVDCQKQARTHGEDEGVVTYDEADSVGVEGLVDGGGTRLGTGDGETILSDSEGRGASVVLGVVHGDEAAHTELDEVEGEEPDLWTCSGQRGDIRMSCISY